MNGGTGNNPADKPTVKMPIVSRSRHTGPAEVPFFFQGPGDLDWTDPDQRELMLAALDEDRDP